MRPGATFECRLTRGATVVFDWAACSSPRTYDLSAEPDGAYTFSVRQTDAAGNTGAAQTHDYALDRGVPAAPSIDSSPPSPDNSTTPSWSFSGEAGATFECRLRRMDGSTVSGWSGCTSPRSYSLAAELDGAYEFSVRQTDAAGNVSASADSWYVLDTTPGLAPAIDSAPSSPGSDPLPTWAFSGEPGATFECRVERGATVVFGWGACSSPRTFDLSGEPDGTYTFSVRQIDGPGNVSPAATDDYALDSQAPGAPSIDSGPASPGNDTSPTFTFSGEAGGSFECRLEDGSGQPVPGLDWAACSSPRSYDLSGSPDGAYSFAVRQIDDAGSTGPAATRPYVLDTTPPPAPVFTTEPPLDRQCHQPLVVLHGRGRRDLRVPGRARSDPRLRLGGLLVAPRPRPLGRAGRAVRVLGPGDRRRRQHRWRGVGQLRPRPLAPRRAGRDRRARSGGQQREPRVVVHRRGGRGARVPRRARRRHRLGLDAVREPGEL